MHVTASKLQYQYSNIQSRNSASTFKPSTSTLNAYPALTHLLSLSLSKPEPQIHYIPGRNRMNRPANACRQTTLHFLLSTRYWILDTCDSLHGGAIVFPFHLSVFLRRAFELSSPTVTLPKIRNSNPTHASSILTLVLATMRNHHK